MKGLKFFLISSLFLTGALSAAVEVKNIKLVEEKGNRATIAITLNSALDSTPEIFVREGLLQVSLPQVTVWPKIEKKVAMAGSEVTLMAYQYEKNLVRFRALIPYSLVGLEKNISTKISGNQVLVDFPVVKQVVENFRAPAVVGKPEDVVQVAAAAPKKAQGKAADYDEGYLETLLKDKKEIKVKKEIQLVEDKVAVGLAAPEKIKDGIKKQDGANMEMLSMVGKFSGFLLVVIGLFFGLVGVFKRSVLKKGKLGFLNNTDVVTVLNTTYIGPKKTLLLVKVHRQVFLLSNDEKGVTYLSEVSDVTGLLKDGEQQVAGANFDSTLVVAEKEEKELKLKDVTTPVVAAPSAPIVEDKTHEEALAQFLETAPVRDQVKFSEQIKNKVKNLKALQ